MAEPASNSPAALRQILGTQEFLVAPGVYDSYGLRCIESAGFKSAAISGAVLSRLLFGQPDAGLVTLTESVEHCHRLTRIAKIPITADAEGGFGNALGVHHTVRLFEEAGAAGINIEDQCLPRPWRSRHRIELVPADEMAAKITAACLARRSDDFVIVARTDSFACESRSDAIARARLYEEAGADLILPMGLSGEDDILDLVNSVRVPVTINAGNGIEPAKSAAGIRIARLAALGVRRVSLPGLLPAASARAVEKALESVQRMLHEPDAEHCGPELLSNKDIGALMGDDDFLALEAALLQQSVPHS